MYKSLKNTLLIFIHCNAQKFTSKSGAVDNYGSKLIFIAKSGEEVRPSFHIQCELSHSCFPWR